MTGIIPTTGNGGVQVRDGAGACQTPANVTNSYCPDADFTSTCEINFLPNDCTARITAAQINAFQAEMLCLAETLNPDGNWNCGSVCNLSAAFNAWQTEQGDDTLWRQMQTHACAMPSRTQAQIDALANPTFIMCDGEGNLVRFPGAANCCPTALNYDPVTGVLTLTYGAGDTLTTDIEALENLAFDGLAFTQTGADWDIPATVETNVEATDNFYFDRGDGVLHKASLDDMADSLFTETCYIIPQKVNCAPGQRIRFQPDADGAGCGRIMVYPEPEDIPHRTRFSATAVSGSRRVTIGDNTARSALVEAALQANAGAPADVEVYPLIDPNPMTMTTAEFCGLSEAGIEMQIVGDTRFSYYMDAATDYPNAGTGSFRDIGGYQFGIAIVVDGVVVAHTIDHYGVAINANNQHGTSLQAALFTTTGADVVVDVFPYMVTNTAHPERTAGDIIGLDMSETSFYFKE